MLVADDVLYAGEGPLHEILEHRAPARSGLTRAEPQAELFAIRVGADTGDPEGGRAADLAVAAHALDMRVDDQ